MQTQAAEEHLGELLRRADGELAAGELMDAVAQLVDTLAHASGDLAQTVWVHLDAGRLHLREDAHQRQLDLAEEAAELELVETRSCCRANRQVSTARVAAACLGRGPSELRLAAVDRGEP